jgi:hypothetical protein
MMLPKVPPWPGTWSRRFPVYSGMTTNEEPTVEPTDEKERARTRAMLKAAAATRALWARLREGRSGGYENEREDDTISP